MPYHRPHDPAIVDVEGVHAVRDVAELVDMRSRCVLPCQIGDLGEIAALIQGVHQMKERDLRGIASQHEIDLRIPDKLLMEIGG